MLRYAAGLALLDGCLPRKAALNRTTVMGRSIVDKQPVHVADLQVRTMIFPSGGSFRAGLAPNAGVPLLRKDRALGTILVRRTEVRPFDDKHIALLKTFADQAAIAVENAHLLNELCRAHRRLTESLERQTAISDILRVIANSPGDVKPVLESLARHAAGICKAPFVDIMLVEGKVMRNHASFGDLGRVSYGDAFVIDRSTVMGRSVFDKEPVQVADLQNAGDEFPWGRELALQYGHRTILVVPLLREGRAFGAILVRRQEVAPVRPTSRSSWSRTSPRRR